jgi:hypothetical protein
MGILRFQKWFNVDVLGFFSILAISFSNLLVILIAPRCKIWLKCGFVAFQAKARLCVCTFASDSLESGFFCKAASSPSRRASTLPWRHQKGFPDEERWLGLTLFSFSEWRRNIEIVVEHFATVSMRRRRARLSGLLSFLFFKKNPFYSPQLNVMYLSCVTIYVYAW